MSTWTSLIGAIEVLAPRQCVDSATFTHDISTDAPVGSEGGLDYEITTKKDDNDMLIELNTWWFKTISQIGNVKNGVIRYNVASIRGTIRSGVFVT